MHVHMLLYMIYPGVLFIIIKYILHYIMYTLSACKIPKKNNQGSETFLQRVVGKLLQVWHTKSFFNSFYYLCALRAKAPERSYISRDCGTSWNFSPVDRLEWCRSRDQLLRLGLASLVLRNSHSLAASVLERKSSDWWIKTIGFH